MNARQLALQILLRYNPENGTVKEQAEGRLRAETFSAQDRALTLELCLGVCREEILLDRVIGAFIDRPLRKLQKEALGLLRLGSYQLFFMDRIPARAAVYETVELCGQNKIKAFVNAVLRSIQRSAHFIQGAKSGPHYFPVNAEKSCAFDRPVLIDKGDEEEVLLSRAYGMPQTLVSRWYPRFDKATLEALLLACRLSPGVSVFSRDEKSCDALLGYFSAEGLRFQNNGLHTLVNAGGNPEDWPAYHEGGFLIQGPTAAAAVDALDPKPGEQILDLCSAPGTKLVRIAWRLQGRGKILAIDASGKRLERIRENLSRCSIANAELRKGDVTDLSSVLQPDETFDRVLLDVPCSNTGVLAKRVEARFRFSPGELQRLCDVQAKMLREASRHVKPGGLLLYSTCSLESGENSDGVSAFIADHENFSLAGECLTLPDKGIDGGYWAKILREA